MVSMDSSSDSDAESRCSSDESRAKRLKQKRKKQREKAKDNFAKLKEQNRAKEATIKELQDKLAQMEERLEQHINVQQTQRKTSDQGRKRKETEAQPVDSSPAGKSTTSRLSINSGVLLKQVNARRAEMNAADLTEGEWPHATSKMIVFNSAEDVKKLIQKLVPEAKVQETQEVEYDETAFDNLKPKKQVMERRVRFRGDAQQQEEKQVEELEPPRGTTTIVMGRSYLQKSSDYRIGEPVEDCGCTVLEYLPDDGTARETLIDLKKDITTRMGVDELDAKHFESAYRQAVKEQVQTIKMPRNKTTVLNVVKELGLEEYVTKDTLTGYIEVLLCAVRALPSSQ